MGEGGEEVGREVRLKGRKEVGEGGDEVRLDQWLVYLLTL